MLLPGPGNDDALLHELAERLAVLSAAVRDGNSEAAEIRFQLAEWLVDRRWLLDLAFWLYSKGETLETRELELMQRLLAARQSQHDVQQEFERRVRMKAEKPGA